MDSESGSLEEAKAEAHGTLSGKYGQLISNASLIAVEDDRILRSIVSKLIRELKCHTVVLYGSKARGAGTYPCDCNLVGFTKDSEESGEIRLLEKSVDAYVYPEKRGLEDTEVLLRLQGGIVLYEENDFGTNLMRRIEAL